MNKNKVNQILAASIKFHPNVPDPDDQDPVEQLEYMESCVSKKQFALMQFIKIYTVLWTDWIEGKVDFPRILMAMEIALKGKKNAFK